jgi:hypothetical protein
VREDYAKIIKEEFKRVDDLKNKAGNKSASVTGLCFVTAKAIDKMNDIFDLLEDRRLNMQGYYPPSIVAKAQQDYDLLKRLGFRKEA